MVATHLDDIAQSLPGPSWVSIYARLCNVIVRSERRGAHDQELPMDDWWDLFIGGASAAEWTDIPYLHVEDQVDSDHDDLFTGKPSA
jgi:hypothetical protein